MPTLIFVEPDGSETTITARSGDTVMRAARAGGVDGIVGECGGCMNCLTCHVFVPEAVAAVIPGPEAVECAMIDALALGEENSRLSCQIVVTDALDGARFGLPEWQG